MAAIGEFSAEGGSEKTSGASHCQQSERESRHSHWIKLHIPSVRENSINARSSRRMQEQIVVWRYEGVHRLRKQSFDPPAYPAFSQRQRPHET